MSLAVTLWKGTSAIAASIPHSISNTLARGIGALVYYLWFTRRKVARENFSRVLGKPAGDKQVGRVAKTSLQNYCTYILDVLRFTSTSMEQVRERVVIHESDSFREVMALGKPLVVVSAHFGNMDYAAPVAAERYRRFTIAAETIKPVALFEYLARVRSARGADLIPYNRAPRKILEAIKRKEIIGFLIDFGVNAHKDINTTEVTFFGERTRFPSSPAILAQRFDAPLVVAYALVAADGRIHVETEPPIIVPRHWSREQAEAETMQLVAQHFEKFIRAHPEQWYAFRPMWPPRARASKPLLERLRVAPSD